MQADLFTGICIIHPFVHFGSLPREQDIWLWSASGGHEWKHGDGEWTGREKRVDVG